MTMIAIKKNFYLQWYYWKHSISTRNSPIYCWLVFLVFFYHPGEYLWWRIFFLFLLSNGALALLVYRVKAVECDASGQVLLLYGMVFKTPKFFMIFLKIFINSQILVYESVYTFFISFRTSIHLSQPKFILYSFLKFPVTFL